MGNVVAQCLAVAFPSHKPLQDSGHPSVQNRLQEVLALPKNEASSLLKLLFLDSVLLSLRSHRAHSLSPKSKHLPPVQVPLGSTWFPSSKGPSLLAVTAHNMPVLLVPGRLNGRITMSLRPTWAMQCKTISKSEEGGGVYILETGSFKAKSGEGARPDSLVHGQGQEIFRWAIEGLRRPDWCPAELPDSSRTFYKADGKFPGYFQLEAPFETLLRIRS